MIRVTLVLEPQPEGGYTVTCPYLPELVTEGDARDEAVANAYDALTAVLELYAEAGRALPSTMHHDYRGDPVTLEMAVPLEV